MWYNPAGAFTRLASEGPFRLVFGCEMDEAIQFWLNLQANHVVWEIELGKSVARIQPIKRRP